MLKIKSNYIVMNQLIREKKELQNSFNYSEILNRTSIANEITTMLQSFDTRRGDVTFKKGIYIWFTR